MKKPPVQRCPVAYAVGYLRWDRSQWDLQTNVAFIPELNGGNKKQKKGK